MEDILNDKNISKLTKKYKGKVINRDIIVKLLKDAIKGEDKREVGEVEITDRVIIDTIKSMRNKFTDEPISENTKEMYLQREKTIDAERILKDLVKNKGNKTEINKIIKDIQGQQYKKLFGSVDGKDDRSKSKSLEYFQLITRLIETIPNLESKLNEYVLNRLNQVKKELGRERLEKTDEKKTFEPLKIEWTEYLKRVKGITDRYKFDGSDYLELQNVILLNLYKLFTIRDDYGKTELLDEDKDEETTNYLNVKTGLFHLNDYKSSSKSKFGNRLYRIPPYLLDLIKKLKDGGYKYLYSNIKQGKDVLFAGGRINRQIGRLLETTFGKKLTIDDLRKSITTYYQQTKSVKKQKELANIILHSYQTGINNYTRDQLDKK